MKFFTTVNNAVLIGSGKNYNPTKQEQQYLNYTGVCLSFDKIIIKEHRYTTSKYADGLKINDSLIRLRLGQYAIIKNIYSFSDGNENKILILLNMISIISEMKTSENLTVSYMKECFINNDNVHVCTPEDIEDYVMIIAFNGINYLCNIPQGCLGD